MLSKYFFFCPCQRQKMFSHQICWQKKNNKKTYTPTHPTPSLQVKRTVRNTLSSLCVRKRLSCEHDYLLYYYVLWNQWAVRPTESSIWTTSICWSHWLLHPHISAPPVTILRQVQVQSVTSSNVRRTSRWSSVKFKFNFNLRHQLLY